MYVSREKGVIVLRPTSFQAHDSHFIVQLCGMVSAKSFMQQQQQQLLPTMSQYVCWRVPMHLRSEHWVDLLTTQAHELTEQLVLATRSGVLDVMSKFEDLRYIHTYIRHVGGMRSHDPSSRRSLEGVGADSTLL